MSKDQSLPKRSLHLHLSAGQQFLQTQDLAPLLLIHLEPRDLKAFVESSIDALWMWQGLSDTNVDEYCEIYAKPFPALASTHGHFLCSGCSCTLSLAASHNLLPDFFTGAQFSQAFWHTSKECRAIERAVRLGLWCNSRRGSSAREFFEYCFGSTMRSTPWWTRLISWLQPWEAASQSSVQITSRQIDEYSIAVANSLMPLG